MTDYQKMIYYRTYAKGDESWESCIQRYMESLFKQSRLKNVYLNGIDMIQLKRSLIEGDIQPSMRLLSSAGKYIEVNNLAQYNCAYLVIDNLRCFSDLFFILLSGCGCSISVENKHIQQLPVIPKLKDFPDYCITVEDSKEGWQYSLTRLFDCLMQGRIPTFNYSKIRKKGEPLKTAGGYASGYKPLEEMLNYVINKFKEAEGLRLRSIDVFDICCKIAQIVVVGGVRRSAILTLFDNNDINMVNAKHGAWAVKHPYRSNSCMSAVYEKKPSMSEFLDHFKHLYDNGEGENGFFNRHVANKQSKRKDENMGINPCGEVVLKNKQLCNLSTVTIKIDDTVDTICQKLILATQLGMIQGLFNHFPTLTPEWEENNKTDPIIAVCLSGIYDNDITANPTKAIQDLFKEVVRKESVRMADILGIKAPKAFTSIKPSGNSSQLYGCSSGIHPAHSQFYKRLVTISKDNPLANFLIEQGVERQESNNPENELFVWYCKSNNKYTNKNVLKIKQLDTIRKYTKYYTNHSVSNTVSVNDDDFLEVINYIWKHYDDFVGITLYPEFPDSNVSPYQEISEIEYCEAKKPKIDWDKFHSDHNNVVTECQGGQCEI
jgi:ribonucleoside-diphosphate reductase alpha chain